MMKIAFCVLLALTSLHPAQAQSYMNAATVESTCKLELSKPSESPGSCIILFRGYIDGFASGADRGLRVAFTQDQKNLATTAGIADVQSRIGQLSSSAACVPMQATAKQVVEVFLQFMKAHPNRRSEPYREPLLDALQSYYCPR